MILHGSPRRLDPEARPVQARSRANNSRALAADGPRPAGQDSARKAVAAWLRAHHLGYRRNVRDLPGRPDFANRRAGFAIFVHGCYWHRHPGCARTTTPIRNRGFWLDKFAANVARDAARSAELEQAGLRTIVVWECETENPRALDEKLGCRCSKPRRAGLRQCRRIHPASGLALAQREDSRLRPRPHRRSRQLSCPRCTADQEILRTADRPDFPDRDAPVRLFDAFAGCGALSVGFLLAGVETGVELGARLAIEREEIPAATYAANIGNVVHREAIETLLDGELGGALTSAERTLKKKVGEVQIGLAGTTMPGHSDLNNHTRRADPRNALYAKVARAAAVSNRRCFASRTSRPSATTRAACSRRRKQSSNGSDTSSTTSHGHAPDRRSAAPPPTHPARVRTRPRRSHNAP